MAHFCELNNDNLIIAAIEVSSNDAPTEEAGIAFLKIHLVDGYKHGLMMTAKENNKEVLVLLMMRLKIFLLLLNLIHRGH